MGEKTKYIGVSVIIPVYNSENTIIKCLDSILNQDYPSKYIEVIAIDNGSTDNSLKILNKYIGQIKIEKCEITGPSPARNKGIQSASNELILLIDADCIASKSLIRQHIEAHKYFNIKDPKVKVIGGGIQGYNKNFWSICDDFCCWYGQHPGVKEKYVHSHPTANMSFPKTLLEKTGCFDEELRYAEDYAFCVNIRNNGYEIYFKPEAKVAHVNRTTFRHFIKHAFNWGKTQYILREKGIVDTSERKNIFSIIIYYIYFSNFILFNLIAHAFQAKRFYVILFLPFIIFNKSILYILEIKDDIKFFLKKKAEGTL